MKYDLTNEIKAAKEYLDSGNSAKLYKNGLVVNPAFCWLGASPDDVVYDPSMEANPFGLFEAKCPFCGAGKKIVDVIKENKQFYLKQTDNGIRLKENHNYYFQVQGLMGVTGMKWCDFCVWTGVDFFQQRILFDETLEWYTIQIDQFLFSKFLRVSYKKRVLTCYQFKKSQNNLTEVLQWKKLLFIGGELL